MLVVFSISEGKLIFQLPTESSCQEGILMLYLVEDGVAADQKARYEIRLKRKAEAVGIQPDAHGVHYVSVLLKFEDRRAVFRLVISRLSTMYQDFTKIISSYMH